MREIFYLCYYFYSVSYFYLIRFYSLFLKKNKVLLVLCHETDSPAEKPC